MDKQTFVIVGAGLAGGTAAGQLRKDGFDGRIVLIGDEAAPPYERPELSKGYLRGAIERQKLDVYSPDSYAASSIELRRSTRVISLEPATREVVLGDGERLRYDRLLLATGSAPRRLDILGSNLAGIHYLRTVQDSEAIRDAAKRAHRAVVIGGGWIGSEVAASLRQLGLEVALVMPGSMPLENVLGPEVGAIYRDLHVERGVELRPHHHVAAFRGRTAVEAVETVDGTRIACDLVVVGVGARPRTELAVNAGLQVRDGIHVSDRLETNVPAIFAAGDIASAWHPLFGTRIRVEHWDNAKRQGRVAARNMLGIGETYTRVPYFYSDQYDLSMEYSGYAPTWDRVVFRGDNARREFIAFWLKSGRVVAGMKANTWDVNDAISALVASREPIAVERLVDPSVPLDDLETLALVTGGGARSAR
jgi:3-phenylpropionate/trans-cinnamate dioxygenase ferredoxin reductase subunit